MAANEYDHLFKMLLVGDGSAGKSELLLKFVGKDDVPSSYISSIGIDFKIKRIELDGKVIKLQMWDTAGQERFRTITTSYYRSAQGILLVFDLTDESSFKDIRSWIDNINKHVDPNVPKILVGNRCAQTERRIIERERAQALADELGIDYIEVDSEDNTNVEKAFMSLAEKIAHSLPAAPEVPVASEVVEENPAENPLSSAVAAIQSGLSFIYKSVSGGDNPTPKNDNPRSPSPPSPK